MDAVSTIAAVALGLIFVVAGGSKLAAGGRWLGQAGEMGAPRPVARVVPWIELALGATLIVQLVMPAPALAAIAVLVVFSVAIGRQLVDGRHPPCACFGGWSTTPLGPGHLVRNVALMVLAVVACWA